MIPNEFYEICELWLPSFTKIPNVSVTLSLTNALITGVQQERHIKGRTIPFLLLHLLLVPTSLLHHDRWAAWSNRDEPLSRGKLTKVWTVSLRVARTPCSFLLGGAGEVAVTVLMNRRGLAVQYRCPFAPATVKSFIKNSLRRCLWRCHPAGCHRYIPYCEDRPPHKGPSSLRQFLFLLSLSLFSVWWFPHKDTLPLSLLQST